MALTYTPIKRLVVGDRIELIVDATFDSSYVTNGLTVTATAIGLGMDYEINHITVGAVVTAAAIQPLKSVVWDHVNSKLILFTTAYVTEATNASNQATTSVRLKVIGKGTVAV